MHCFRTGLRVLCFMRIVGLTAKVQYKFLNINIDLNLQISNNIQVQPNVITKFMGPIKNVQAQLFRLHGRPRSTAMQHYGSNIHHAPTRNNNISNDNHKDRTAAQTNKARSITSYHSRSLLLWLQPALSCPVQQEGIIGPVHMSTIVFAVNLICFTLSQNIWVTMKVFIGRTTSLVRSTKGIYFWECWQNFNVFSQSESQYKWEMSTSTRKLTN